MKIGDKVKLKDGTAGTVKDIRECQPPEYLIEFDAEQPAVWHPEADIGAPAAEHPVKAAAHGHAHDKK